MRVFEVAQEFKIGAEQLMTLLRGMGVQTADFHVAQARLAARRADQDSLQGGSLALYQQHRAPGVLNNARGRAAQVGAAAGSQGLQ